MAGQLPTTRDRSKGFWARMVVILFLNTFEGGDADTNLRDEFVPEMVDPQLGHRRLPGPSGRGLAVRRDRRCPEPATLGYRRETDAVLSWFDERDRGRRAHRQGADRSALFDDYCEHCRRFRFDNYTRFAKRLKQIIDGHEGQPWSTAAQGGTPFSMSFHRDARMMGYVGNLKASRRPVVGGGGLRGIHCEGPIRALAAVSGSGCDG